MRGHLPGGQPLGHQRDDQVIDPGQPALPLTDQLRLETASPVPRDTELHRTDVGEHGLGAVAVAVVVRADPLMRLVAQVLGHLLVQSGLDHGLGQRLEQPVGPWQRNTP